MEEDRRKSVFYVLCFVLVVCLYQVVYGRLMDAKTRPLFGLYRLRFVFYTLSKGVYAGSNTATVVVVEVLYLPHTIHVPVRYSYD